MDSKQSPPQRDAPTANPHTLWEQTQKLVCWIRGLADLDPRSEMNRMQRLMASNARIVLLVFRMEVYQRIKLYAQALTLATLLALVPSLAVLFSIVMAIANGVGGMETIALELETLVLSNITGSPELHASLSATLRSLVANVNGGKLGGISVAILLVSVLSLLNHIETSFNRIFSATHARPVGIRLLIYWAVITLGPILLIASVAFSAALQTSSVTSWLSEKNVAGMLLLRSIPLLTTWFAFMVLYLTVPATRVRLGAAFLAAVIAGSMWNMAKWGFGHYVQNNVTTQNVYGSLAVIPLFILWIYLSWLLVLFGGQLTFAFQHAATYRPEDDDEAPNQRALEQITCRVFLEISTAFYAGQHALTRSSIGQQLNLAAHMVEHVLMYLRLGGFIEETDDNHVIPARDISQISVNQILSYLRSTGTSPLLYDDAPRQYLHTLLSNAEHRAATVTSEVNFRELAERFSGSLDRLGGLQDEKNI